MSVIMNSKSHSSNFRFGADNQTGWNQTALPSSDTHIPDTYVNINGIGHWSYHSIIPQSICFVMALLSNQHPSMALASALSNTWYLSLQLMPHNTQRPSDDVWQSWFIAGFYGGATLYAWKHYLYKKEAYRFYNFDYVFYAGGITAGLFFLEF